MYFFDEGISNRFARKAIGNAAEPLFLFRRREIWRPVNLDLQHRPLVGGEPIQSGYPIVFKVTDGLYFAAECTCRQRQRLPGVSDIVQAVAIAATLIFPRFAPSDC